MIGRLQFVEDAANNKNDAREELVERGADLIYRSLLHAHARRFEAGEDPTFLTRESNQISAAAGEQLGAIVERIFERIALLRPCFESVDSWDIEPSLIEAAGIPLQPGDHEIVSAIRIAEIEGTEIVTRRGPMSNTRDTETARFLSEEISANSFRRREVELAIDELDLEAAVMKAQLEAMNEPPLLRFAGGVLLYFSLAGIVTPIALMGLRPVPDGSGIRALVLSLFILGLTSVGIYLWRSASMLEWTDQSESA